MPCAGRWASGARARGTAWRGGVRGGLRGGANDHPSPPPHPLARRRRRPGSRRVVLRSVGRAHGPSRIDAVGPVGYVFPTSRPPTGFFAPPFFEAESSSSSSFPTSGFSVAGFDPTEVPAV